MDLKINNLESGSTYLIFKKDVVYQIEILNKTNFCYYVSIDNGKPHWLYIERMENEYNGVIEKLK